MPWCPKCGSEYREGFTECADCKVVLVETQPDSLSTHPEAVSDPVVVYETSRKLDADMICEMLQNADIPAYPHVLSALGEMTQIYTGMPLDGMQILVDRSQAEAAREILQIWASQDARAPISEEELTRAALQSLDEAELTAQAEAEEPAALVENGSSMAMKIALGLIALLALVLLYFAKIPV